MANAADLVAQNPFPASRIVDDEVEAVAVAVFASLCGLNRPFRQARHFPSPACLVPHSVPHFGAAWGECQRTAAEGELEKALNYLSLRGLRRTPKNVD